MRPFWILIVLAVIAAGAGGYFAASWPGFRVKKIVVAGQRVVPKTDIMRYAAIRGSDNVWLQNMNAAATRIKAIPYIDDVKIRRALPAVVSIVVTERKPFAVVRDRERNVLVDERLRVLSVDAVRNDLPLFVSAMPPVAPGEFLTDERLKALARDYETLERAHVPARLLSFTKLQELVAVMPSGIVLKLGDDSNLEQKAALVDPILSQTQAQGRRIRALDLRAPKTPVVVFR